MVGLIEGGFVAQTLLVILVWGGIVLLTVIQRPIPAALLDVGLMIAGFYFHTMVTRTVGLLRRDKNTSNR